MYITLSYLYLDNDDNDIIHRNEYDDDDDNDDGDDDKTNDINDTNDIKNSDYCKDKNTLKQMITNII